MHCFKYLETHCSIKAQEKKKKKGQVSKKQAFFKWVIKKVWKWTWKEKWSKWRFRVGLGVGRAIWAQKKNKEQKGCTQSKIGVCLRLYKTPWPARTRHFRRCRQATTWSRGEPAQLHSLRLKQQPQRPFSWSLGTERITAEGEAWINVFPLTRESIEARRPGDHLLLIKRRSLAPRALTVRTWCDILLGCGII